MGRVIRRDALVGEPIRLSAEAARRAERVIDDAAAGERIARDRGLVAEVAAHMAERIVGDALERRPALLDALFERALAEIGALRPARIRVHPEDRARTGIDAAAAARGMEVADDPSVGRGGCVVEARGASSDHRLEVLLEALRAAAEGTSRD
ncbi:MAG: flagellar assembly protein FliH [Proteobacteria bacterium]|jgi:flagellar biosynthesis/type III secretory pathway protein FliH|nr:flagellar assembly protein FliH [Pseudomonadota bacterium]